MIQTAITAPKMKISSMDFLSKWDIICRKLQIWSHLLKKPLMENFIFSAVHSYWYGHILRKIYFRSYILVYLVYVIFIYLLFSFFLFDNTLS